MDKNEVLLNLFLEREDLKNKILEVKKELEQIKSHHYAIGAPLNDNILKFDKRQLHYLRMNLDRIENSLGILEGE